MKFNFAAFAATLFISISASLAHAQAPVLQCVEACKKYELDGSCSYRSSCLFQGDCVTATDCLRFDFFGKCSDERVAKTCAVAACPGYPIPSPNFPITCESSCQKRNTHGDCVYTTSCEINARCVKITTCEKFDSFGDKCESERIEQTCY